MRSSKIYQQAMAEYQDGDISLSPDTRPPIVEDVMDDIAAYRVRHMCTYIQEEPVYREQRCDHDWVYKDVGTPHTWIAKGRRKGCVDVYVTPPDKQLRASFEEASWECDCYFLAADYTYGALKGKVGEGRLSPDWRRIGDELQQFLLKSAVYCALALGEPVPWRDELPYGPPLYMEQIKPTVLCSILEATAKKLSLRWYGEWL